MKPKDILIFIIIILTIVYLGQTQKAVRVEEARLEFALEKGKITQEQFKTELKNDTFIRMFFNPRYVLSVD